MRSGHGGNSIFFNENNKDCTSRTIATPHPLHPIASHFCLTNPHPLPPPLLHTHTYIHTNTHTHTHTHTHTFPQSGRHMCITLNKIYQGICCCGDTYIGETIQNLE